MPLEGFEPPGSEISIDPHPRPRGHWDRLSTTFNVPNRNAALVNSIKPKSDEYRMADGYSCLCYHIYV